jgi:hypothetical protein
MNSASVEIVSRGRRFQIVAMETEAQGRMVGVKPVRPTRDCGIEIIYETTAATAEPLQDCMMRCAREWMARHAS